MHFSLHTTISRPPIKGIKHTLETQTYAMKMHLVIPYFNIISFNGIGGIHSLQIKWAASLMSVDEH